MARVRNSPIDICSYKRAGTHFISATIWLNFAFSDVSVLMRIRGNKCFLEYDGGLKKPGDVVSVPWGQLWCSHKPFKPEFDPGRVLYIVRDPIATLMSGWRMDDPNQTEDPRSMIGPECIEMWLAHVRSYVDRGCMVVRYEDMIGDEHDSILESIGIRFGLVPKSDGFVRLSARVGWYPYPSFMQPSEPPSLLLDAVASGVPRGFLGYNL